MYDYLSSHFSGVVRDMNYELQVINYELRIKKCLPTGDLCPDGTSPTGTTEGRRIQNKECNPTEVGKNKF